MPSNKLTFDTGNPQEVWGTGRGYAPPAPTGSPVTIPPQWNDDPSFVELMRQHQQAQPEQSPQPIVPSPQPEPQPDERVASSDLDAIIKARLAELDLPKESVNIDKGTARFRGHSLVLSGRTQNAIKRLLATEVVTKLKEEQRRVVDSVQHQRLRPLRGARGQDVLPVPGEAPSVDAEAATPKRQVRRVRKQTANIRAKDVRRVQSKKGGEA